MVDQDVCMCTSFPVHGIQYPRVWKNSRLAIKLDHQLLVMEGKALTVTTLMELASHMDSHQGNTSGLLQVQ